VLVRDSLAGTDITVFVPLSLTISLPHRRSLEATNIRIHHNIQEFPTRVKLAQTPICAHLFQVITLRLYANVTICNTSMRWRADLRSNPLPTITPLSRYHFPTANQSPSDDPISSLFLRWLNSQDLPIFKRFSSLPCRVIRKRRASHCPIIHSSCKSRFAIPWSRLLRFCKTKHRPSVIYQNVIESSNRSRLLYQF